MTRDDSLLRAILDAPDDDLPRLIYADWLDEHGEPARAEFIRVQCELAHCSRCGGDGTAHGTDRPFEWSGPASYPGVCPGCAALRRRERELLDGQHCNARGCTNRLAWAAPVSAWTTTFVRGFVSTVRLPAADFLTHADAILDACPIRGRNHGTAEKPEYPEFSRDGVVRLTTWPDRRWPIDSAVARLAAGDSETFEEFVMQELTATWPGVRFDLSAATVPWSTRATATPVAAIQRMHAQVEPLLRERMNQAAEELGIRDARTAHWRHVGRATDDRPHWQARCGCEAPEIEPAFGAGRVTESILWDTVPLTRTRVELRIDRDRGRSDVHGGSCWIGQCPRCRDVLWMSQGFNNADQAALLRAGGLLTSPEPRASLSDERRARGLCHGCGQSPAPLPGALCRGCGGRLFMSSMNPR